MGATSAADEPTRIVANKAAVNGIRSAAAAAAAIPVEIAGVEASPGRTSALMTAMATPIASAGNTGPPLKPAPRESAYARPFATTRSASAPADPAAMIAGISLCPEKTTPTGRSAVARNATASRPTRSPATTRASSGLGAARSESHVRGDGWRRPRLRCRWRGGGTSRDRRVAPSRRLAGTVAPTRSGAVPASRRSRWKTSAPVPAARKPGRNARAIAFGGIAPPAAQS